MLGEVRERRAVRAIVLATALAAAGGATLAQPAIDAADLVGVWRGVEVSGPLVIAGEVIFHADGHYQRVNVLGRLMNLVAGDYRVAGPLVHFVPTDYQPREILGIPQYPPPSETWLVDRLGDGHLHARVGQSELTFERVDRVP